MMNPTHAAFWSDSYNNVRDTDRQRQRQTEPIAWDTLTRMLPVLKRLKSSMHPVCLIIPYSMICNVLCKYSVIIPTQGCHKLPLHRDITFNDVPLQSSA